MSLLRPKPYVSPRELSELTPWTLDAIEGMVKRGVLKYRKHWFRPPGRRERIFKWDAIVDLIEGKAADSSPMTRPGFADHVPMLNGGKLDVPKT